MTSDVTQLRACGKTIFRIRIPTKSKKTNEITQIPAKSAGQESENKII